jgi:2-desacetyl-2-hydroxyethyl bacteriochlorophyllide A dehydrogenase
VRREVLWFTGPRRLEIREEELPPPLPDQVTVDVALTGISAGTEMLVYRGELPEALEADSDPIARNLTYPTPFGYCSVGRVVALGQDIDPAWKGRLVFAFQSHASSYSAPLHALLAVPPGISAQDAVFLANAETAVNLVHDAAPLLGERVLVLGQGTVGLLTAGLLRDQSLACLVTADLHRVRREAAMQLGVTAVLDPGDPEFVARALSHTGGAGFDIVIELTGNPAALDLAMSSTAFSGRIIVGSWYGRRQAPLDLGGRFHRSRIQVRSSQVSTIAPELMGRWDKGRRFGVAGDAMRRIEPGRWITHRFSIGHADEAFRLLDTAQESTIQVVLEYPDPP